MPEIFNFHLHTDVYYGLLQSKKLGEFLKDRDLSHVLILVDEGCARKSEYFGEIREIIKKNVDQLHLELIRGTKEPDYDYLDEVSDRARSVGNVDVVIGIGGGSCLDITKAVAVLMTNPGKGIEYRGFDKVIKPGIPTIAVPTTAGTGSEVTINAVFTDKKEMKKLGINGRFMDATYAILDAEWTMSCPHPVAVSSGMDAMTHALESFMCRQHNALTRIYSREAFRILYENLQSLVDAPQDREKRQLLLLGSHLAAIALFNSGSGISGAISYPLGVHFKIPHGICGGIFLSSVVDYNVSRGYTDYAELIDAIECNPAGSLADKSEHFSELLKLLVKKLDVPSDLDSWGITKKNVQEVAMLMHPLQAAFDQNPIPFSAKDDALEMLKKHIKPS